MSKHDEDPVFKPVSSLAEDVLDADMRTPASEWQQIRDRTLQAIRLQNAQFIVHFGPNQRHDKGILV